jgi:hypothetical protein
MGNSVFSSSIASPSINLSILFSHPQFEHQWPRWAAIEGKPLGNRTNPNPYSEIPDPSPEVPLCLNTLSRAARSGVVFIGRL